MSDYYCRGCATARRGPTPARIAGRPTAPAGLRATRRRRRRRAPPRAPSAAAAALASTDGRGPDGGGAGYGEGDPSQGGPERPARRGIAAPGDPWSGPAEEVGQTRRARFNGGRLAAAASAAAAAASGARVALAAELGSATRAWSAAVPPPPPPPHTAAPVDAGGRPGAGDGRAGGGRQATPPGARLRGRVVAVASRPMRPMRSRAGTQPAPPRPTRPARDSPRRWASDCRRAARRAHEARRGKIAAHPLWRPTAAPGYAARQGAGEGFDT